MAAPSAQDFTQRWRPVAIVIFPIAAIVAALALLWLADETHYRGCLEKVAVQYPAVPVSAFVEASRANVGPLKVSYAQQRLTAANSCHHL